VVDRVPREHARVHLTELLLEVLGEQLARRLAQHLAFGVAEDPLRAAVPRRHPSLEVVAEQRVAGRLGEGLENGQPFGGCRLHALGAGR
jgi:hypothetical protein